MLPSRRQGDTIASMLSGEHRIDMTEGPILSKLLRFSVPIILSGILQLFFNAADIIVVGRFAGDNSLAAVGSTGSVVNLLVNLFVGLSVGTNVVAAGYFGAGKRSEVGRTVHTAMVLSALSGLVLTAAGVAGARWILRMMQAPDGVLELASVYLQIYFGGITATLIYNFGSALLRAKGDTARPLYILLAAGIINVCLNLLFVIVFSLDVAGVALATVISQCFAAFMVVRCLMSENDEFRLEFRRLCLDRDILVRIIRIGVPAGFQGIIFSLSNVIIQSSVNSFGPSVIAGNSAASNLEGFVYTAMNGMSQGTLTFVSQNMGAGKTDRIRRAVAVSLVSVLVLGTMLGNAVVLAGPGLLGIYSSSSDVISAGMERLRIICTCYALCGLMDVLGNAVRGTGHSSLPMVVTLVGACGVRLLWLASVFRIPEFHTCTVIFLSYPISWAVTLAAHAVCLAVSLGKLDRTAAGVRP